MKTKFEEFIENPSNQKLLEREIFFLNITEKICELMKKDGVTKVELARRLKLSQSSLSKDLSGSRNMTLRKITDYFFALGHRVSLEVTPLDYKTKS